MKQMRQDRAQATAARDHRLACGPHEWAAGSRVVLGCAAWQQAAEICPCFLPACLREHQRRGTQQTKRVNQTHKQAHPVVVDLLPGVCQGGEGQEGHNECPHKPGQAPVRAAGAPLVLRAAQGESRRRWGKGLARSVVRAAEWQCLPRRDQFGLPCFPSLDDTLASKGRAP